MRWLLFAFGIVLLFSYSFVAFFIQAQSDPYIYQYKNPLFEELEGKSPSRFQLSLGLIVALYLFILLVYGAFTLLTLVFNREFSFYVAVTFFFSIPYISSHLRSDTTDEHLTTSSPAESKWDILLTSVGKAYKAYTPIIVAVLQVCVLILSFLNRTCAWNVPFFSSNPVFEAVVTSIAIEQVARIIEEQKKTIYIGEVERIIKEKREKKMKGD